MEDEIEDKLAVEVEQVPYEQWFTLWVSSNHEQEVIDELKRRNVDCTWILPTYKRFKKFHQEWHQIVRPMFPGYVFFTTQDIHAFSSAIYSISQFTKILTVEKKPIPLAKHEVEFIKKITGENFCSDVSYGFIEGDKVVVTQGPLRFHEGFIKKIDRHKRLATLELDMFGRNISINMALEIIYKK
ncbi:MAG: antiterminator LoaP [Fibrobacter sp.]|nr:antiterminator LoaP [Fibrobacter sp.]